MLFCLPWLQLGSESRATVGKSFFVSTLNKFWWTTCISIYGFHDSELTKSSRVPLRSHTQFLLGYMPFFMRQCLPDEKKIYIWESKMWNVYPTATKATEKHSFFISIKVMSIRGIHLLIFLLHSARSIQPQPHTDGELGTTGLGWSWKLLCKEVDQRQD